MKKALPFILLLFTLTANAQNYLISFAGTGESTTVTSVKVENLATGATLILNGTDILRLSTSTGINTFNTAPLIGMDIYPNPMNAYSLLKIHPPEEGMATISIIDISGRITGQIKCYLNKSVNYFRLSGMNAGLYLVNVRGLSWQHTEKLLSQNFSEGRISIDKLGNNPIPYPDINNEVKGIDDTRDMAYSKGQMLKFTGTSGDYTTIITDAPESDKTIMFEFVKCIDGDDNDYPVIITNPDEGKCPRQIWMAVNLRTSKYNDGINLPLVTGSVDWNNLVSPGYCWYDNSESENKDIYGALYNWFAVNTGKLCPAGWHIPTYAEWSGFSEKNGGKLIAGARLKEAGTLNWKSPNTGATNISGFTARPGGNRHLDGSFLSRGKAGRWWSATEKDEMNAWFWSLYYNSTEMEEGYFNKKDGFSVRCLKNY